MAKKSLSNPAKTEDGPQTGLQFFHTLMQTTYFRTRYEQTVSATVARLMLQWLVHRTEVVDFNL